MTHSFDDLSPSEIRSISSLVKSDEKFTPTTIFNSISLHEPDKRLYLQLKQNNLPLDSIPRTADVILIDYNYAETSTIAELLVDVKNNSILSWKQLENVQPTITPEDCSKAEQLVKQCPQIHQLLLERGWISDLTDPHTLQTQLKRIVCDPWSYGYSDDGWNASSRLVQTFMYVRYNCTLTHTDITSSILEISADPDDDQDDNHYAHPLDFVPVVDLFTGKIVKVDLVDYPSHFKSIPPKTPLRSANYMSKFTQDSHRTDIEPLEVVQPNGPSFKVGKAVAPDASDYFVKWQKWSFHVGFNYREGLVLRDITYDDVLSQYHPSIHHNYSPQNSSKATQSFSPRSVVYRMALSEMAVPYGDPHSPFHRKHAFDVGDYGLGFCANSLSLGCDCLGHIHYFDGVFNDHSGEPVVLKNAVCMHEEDVGILWKHVEYRNGKQEVRRSRRLVISFISTVVNYEYLFYYSLYQDGTIQFEIKATGMLSTNLYPSDDIPKHGTLVLPNVIAQHHQHMFCARIDMAVDGLDNTVSEVNAEALPTSPRSNPYGNAFCTKETPFTSELEAIRDACPDTARYWKVFNPHIINPITKKPVAYKLMPAQGPRLLAQKESWFYKRANFATHNLYVTPYSEDELFAAGKFPNQYKGGDGVVKWTQQDRNIESTDITLWYVFGLCHIPRIEDFPVMPTESTGFMLKPVGFFNANPANDLPPPTSLRSVKTCCHAT